MNRLWTGGAALGPTVVTIEVRSTGVVDSLSGYSSQCLSAKLPSEAVGCRGGALRFARSGTVQLDESQAREILEKRPDDDLHKAVSRSGCGQ